MVDIERLRALVRDGDEDAAERLWQEAQRRGDAVLAEEAAVALGDAARLFLARSAEVSESERALREALVETLQRAERLLDVVEVLERWPAGEREGALRVVERHLDARWPAELRYATFDKVDDWLSSPETAGFARLVRTLHLPGAPYTDLPVFPEDVTNAITHLTWAHRMLMPIDSHKALSRLRRIDLPHVRHLTLRRFTDLREASLVLTSFAPSPTALRLTGLLMKKVPAEAAKLLMLATSRRLTHLELIDVAGSTADWPALSKLEHLSITGDFTPESLLERVLPHTDSLRTLHITPRTPFTEAETGEVLGVLGERNPNIEVRVHSANT